MAELISGYAIPYNSEAVISGLFRERISPGAFDKSIRLNQDVLCLYGHDYNRVLGRTASGTLELRSDRAGLWFALTPDGTTPDGATAIGTVRRQDVRGTSFGFSVTRETWEDGGDYELPLRTIEEARLYELSLVSLPAYGDATSASLSRAASPAAICDSVRRAEAAMRLRGIN